eukprot:Rhum_TRINITY_DN14470_c27_g1::Rhum_TRINITY_DN14470_c27_g1_i1::g.91654::m.91654
MVLTAADKVELQEMRARLVVMSKASSVSLLEICAEYVVFEYHEIQAVSGGFATLSVTLPCPPTPSMDGTEVEITMVETESSASPSCVPHTEGSPLTPRPPPPPAAASTVFLNRVRETRLMEAEATLQQSKCTSEQMMEASLSRSKRTTEDLAATMSLRRNQSLHRRSTLSKLCTMPPPQAGNLLDVIESATFGVELEAFTYVESDEMGVDVVSKMVNDFVPRLNSQMDDSRYSFRFHTRAASKLDTRFDHWKFTTDSSIASEDGRPIFAFEVVSPKLCGWRGLADAYAVSSVIKLLDASSNNTTALHVHVSCEGYTDEQMTRLVAWYVHFEPIIDLYQAFARRGDNSKYCRSLTRSILGRECDLAQGSTDVVNAVKMILDCENFSAVCQLANPRVDIRMQSRRNHKLNLQLARNTTVGTSGRRVEYRQHAGSCDPEEITLWARLVCCFTHCGAVATEIPPPRPAKCEELWSFLCTDVVLKTYYTRKRGILPPGPEDFRPAFRCV